MSATPANLLAGVAGAASAFELCWVADASGAVAPTDATTALDASFKSIGLVTTDGATTATAITSSDINSFGSFQPTRTLIQTEVLTVHFVAQETNLITDAIKTRQVLTAVVSTTGHKIALTRGAARDTKYAIVIDALDGTNHIRKFYPSARLTAMGDQQIGFGAAVVYDFTFTAYPDSSGNSEYEYQVVTAIGS